MKKISQIIVFAIQGLIPCFAQSVIVCKNFDPRMPEAFAVSHYYFVDQSKKEIRDASDLPVGYKSIYKTISWSETSIHVESYSGTLMPESDDELRKFTQTKINRISGELSSWQRLKDKKGKVLSDSEVENYAEKHGFVIGKGLFPIEPGVFHKGKCLPVVKQF